MKFLLNVLILSLCGTSFTFAQVDSATHHKHPGNFKGYSQFGIWELNLDNGIVSPALDIYSLPNKRNVPFDVPFLLKIKSNNVKNINSVNIGYSEISSTTDWARDTNTALCCNNCEKSPCISKWQRNVFSGNSDSIILTIPPLNSLKQYKFCVEIAGVPETLMTRKIEQRYKVLINKKLNQLLHKSNITTLTNEVIEESIVNPLKEFISSLLKDSLCKDIAYESWIINSPNNLCDNSINEKDCKYLGLGLIDWFDLYKLFNEDTNITKSILDYNNAVGKYKTAEKTFAKFTEDVKKYYEPSANSKNEFNTKLYDKLNRVLPFDTLSTYPKKTDQPDLIKLTEIDIGKIKDRLNAESKRYSKEIAYIKAIRLSKTNREIDVTNKKIDELSKKDNPDEKKIREQSDKLDSLILDQYWIREDSANAQSRINSINELLVVANDYSDNYTPEKLEELRVSALTKLQKVNFDSFLSKLFAKGNISLASISNLTVNTLANFRTRSDWYIVPDIGMAYVFGKQKPVEFAPYYGLQFHLGPINKQITFNLFKANNFGGSQFERIRKYINYAFSLNFGLTMLSIDKPEKFKGVIGNFGIMCGAGLRVFDFFRVNGGILISKQKDSNPLLENTYNAGIAPFVSLSLDLDLQEYITQLIDRAKINRLTTP